MTKTLKNTKISELTFAFILFLAVFYVSRILSFKVSNEYPRMAIMLGATVLTLLCILVIHGFSKLNLHRSKYLLIGGIGLVGAMYFATPMVNNARNSNQVKRINFRALEICLSGSLDYSASSCLMKAVKNDFGGEFISFLSDNLREPLQSILFLAMAQIVLASGIGLWIGSGIDKISHLLPVALVAGFADIWSVFAGATSEIIASPSINYFFLRFPVLGMERLQYLIGLTDYLFYAIFFQAAVRFGLGAKKNMLLLISSFLVTVGFALYFKLGLPVLPFMGALFVLGNYKKLSISKKEGKEMFYFLLAIGAVFFLITYLMGK
jgi:hypothetical protein